MKEEVSSCTETDMGYMHHSIVSGHLVINKGETRTGAGQGGT